MTSFRSAYSAFAQDFSSTRYSKWASVRKFLSTVEKHHTILELACGNGKNLVGYESQSIGIDVCPELCEITRQRGIETHCMDVLDFKSDEKFDFILCIAVIHHLKTREERRQLLQIIRDNLKTGGKALITTWVPSKYPFGENNITFKGYPRFYYVYSPNEFQEDVESVFGEKLRTRVFFNEMENDCVFIS